MPCKDSARFLTAIINKTKRGCLIKNRDAKPLFDSKSEKNSISIWKSSSFVSILMFLGRGSSDLEQNFSFSSVNKQKQLSTVFAQCLTEIRRNKARLCQAHISTIFQEVEAYLRTSSDENGKNKQKIGLNGENRRFSTLIFTQS